jgi:flagellar assembly factor FliW
MVFELKSPLLGFKSTQKIELKKIDNLFTGLSDILNRDVQ